MNLSSFDYHLPNELIALRPSRPRDSSRLLVVNKRTKEISITIFKNIVDYLSPIDLLIFNNTKVDPLLLNVKDESNKNREILLEKKINVNTWSVLTKNPKKTKIFFDDELTGSLYYKNNQWQVSFDSHYENVVSKYGKMPIPPYIKRDSDDFDKIDYQTIFASKSGSIAAPTAGLHFSNDLMASIKNNGIQTEYITLHVGLGTFLPIKTESISNHQMHKERFFVDKKLIRTIEEENKRIISIGTTTLRAIESVGVDKDLLGKWSETDLFIKDGFNFNFIDGLLTNFHLPKSTLLVLVSAFLGYELTMKCYETAIKEKFRFYSYGDAMLIINS
tara:strand:+ start:3501 stop:4496 length:996 start_codon:yes stop_codon:yes gene_type:complete